jgi:hypothetical protein
MSRTSELLLTILREQGGEWVPGRVLGTALYYRGCDVHPETQRGALRSLAKRGLIETRRVGITSAREHRAAPGA